jgi:hypothetical protein
MKKNRSSEVPYEWLVAWLEELDRMPLPPEKKGNTRVVLAAMRAANRKNN